jgi:hypothetical protein
MNTLVQYVRNRKGQLIGAVVGLKIDTEKNSEMQVGWSLCRTKVDKFDKNLAVKIATDRALLGTNIRVPHSVGPVYSNMVKRASKYFNLPLGFQRKVK